MFDRRPGVHNKLAQRVGGGRRGGTGAPARERRSDAGRPQGVRRQRRHRQDRARGARREERACHLFALEPAAARRVFSQWELVHCDFLLFTVYSAMALFAVFFVFCYFIWFSLMF